ncbi:MAG: guanine deaminase [Alphaproteobacteria bacterium]|jgi:guanine deaminase
MADIYRANFFHSPAKGQIERIDDAFLLIEDGAIASVVTSQDHRWQELQNEPATDLRDQGFLLPGFVDLHIHAPQFPQLGQALDVPLEVWLQTHTFPLEARYKDLDYADGVYRTLVRTLLANGTTTAMYFATIHNPASLRLAEICLEMGQRALVGRVAMDLADECPDFYRDASAEESVALTEEFIAAVPGLAGNHTGLVKPVITPRFIPSCSDKALQGLGDMAHRTGAHVQTHCSESDWEHGHVLARCGKTDTEALAEFGLLGRHTILAHSNFITDDDMDMIRKRGAGVAHCPLSNVYFSNAVFPLRRALEKGLHVGLGTDISGGPSASLLDSVRMSIAASRMMEDGVDAKSQAGERGTPDSRIDFRTAFWLATRGGGEALDLPVGCFTPGNQFDAILVRLPEEYHGDEDAAGDALLQKIVMLATRESIHATFVAGRLVNGAV